MHFSPEYLGSDEEPRAQPVATAQRGQSSVCGSALSSAWLIWSVRQSMAKPDYLLAITTDLKGQVMVHADAKGLAALIECLERIKKKVQLGECDHDHLYTDAWAGSELSETSGCEKGFELVHHLKIHGWTEERATKHGFIE